jgi:hypothetical protein
MTATWPTNSLTGEPEPPAKDWLITRLATFGGHGADREAVINLAMRFAFTITSIRTRLDKSIVSPKNELKNLYAAARRSIKTRDNRRYLTSWATVTDRTRRAVWRPKPPLKNALKFTVTMPRRISFMAPDPRDALPLIRDAMAKLKEQSAAARRRSTDPLFDELDGLVREAWRVLRGTPLPKPISPERAGGEHLQSLLIDLARDIDQRFKLGVYVAKDSRRLRGLSRPA